jgi:FKBP-type peptidyl-prolyl cis-trans isomerase FkpA
MRILIKRFFNFNGLGLVLFSLIVLLLASSCDKNAEISEPTYSILILDSLHRYEDSVIRNHIDSLGWQATWTNEGVYVITTKSSNSKIYPDSNSTVRVDYLMYSLKGIAYDSSQNKTLPSIFDLQEVIKGFQIGITNIEVGGAATFIVPSHLGWGSEGLNSIPPNEILIYDVELLEIL